MHINIEGLRDSIAGLVAENGRVRFGREADQRLSDKSLVEEFANELLGIAYDLDEVGRDEPNLEPTVGQAATLLTSAAGCRIFRSGWQVGVLPGMAVTEATVRSWSLLTIHGWLTTRSMGVSGRATVPPKARLLVERMARLARRILREEFVGDRAYAAHLAFQLSAIEVLVEGLRR